MYHIRTYIIIPGTSALPDIYARLPKGAQRPRASAYICIRQGMSAWDITNMLYTLSAFCTLKSALSD